MEHDIPLDSLKGIGEKTKRLFEKAGVANVQQLLEYFPRAWEQYGKPVPIAELQEGGTVSAAGRLIAPVSNRYIRGTCISAAVCSDGRGELSLIWYNMPYLKNSLRTGCAYVFRGAIKKKGQRLLMEQPAVFHADQYGQLADSLQPVYPLTRGLTVHIVQKAVRQALERQTLHDWFPEKDRERFGICALPDAIAQMHFPKNSKELLEARKRLVFDEFFFFLLQLRSLKQVRERSENHFAIRPRGAADRVIASLPYELTGAQKRVWADLLRELQGQAVMARLIQGDVGSGKTIVSVLALLTVAENGLQSALMAPTEVLARQHYDLISGLLKENSLPFEAELLTGSMTAAQRRKVYAKMASGEAAILIGTQALIQEKAVYKNLALVITDEQHRFGVRQRELLALKGNSPHTIVMSATPIPRTLAVILYGDLDISVINEMPANRLPVKNCVVGPEYRQKAWEFIEKQVRLGHQAYVICPMAEESETVDAENVVRYCEKLASALPESMTVAYLHGQMKPAKKNEIMGRFLCGAIQVLVSTTVVEVGVNVPNTTVMLIENAERFGLAQLHQLRGRVGRGDAQSYCIFLHAACGPQIQERLEILKHSNDGFVIANRDMQLRGPGDLFGVRQSGLMEFRIADIYADAAVLSLANEAVGYILEEDPDLEWPEHRGLKQKYEQLLCRKTEHLNL